MKITEKILKSLINEVLDEATQNTEYERIMNMFKGLVDSVDQVAILTPENPFAESMEASKNAKRAEEFEKELARAGYGFRIVSGMYEGPEDSYFVPHMTYADAERLSYKYGQESFIHSVKTVGEMNHVMYFIDWKEAPKEIDPKYPEAEFGPVFIVPDNVPIKEEEFSGTISDDEAMSSATDYYSHVPDKTWDTKKKGGEIRPGGYKRGKKFSIDFYGDGDSRQQGLPTGAEPRSPRFVREANYLFIKESDVPNTMEAQKLVERIKDLSKQIVESSRLGSSRYRGRHRLLKYKRQLQEMIDRGA